MSAVQFSNPFTSASKYGRPGRGTISRHTAHHCSAVCLLPPFPLTPSCCQCVWCVFVWRCFDRRCLCVWAVLAGRRVCPVQSWWRAKCSLRTGCAFQSAQPPWTLSRQTAAGGTPLPLSFSLSLPHTHREAAASLHISLFSSLPAISESFLSSFFLLFFLVQLFSTLRSLFLFLQRHILE